MMPPAIFVLFLKSNGPDAWDESKHPRAQDGKFSHAAFHPDHEELEAYRRDVTRWFGLPAIARNRGLPLSLGKPPTVLRMLGVGTEPLQIDRGTLIKVSRPHGEDPKGHGITLEQLKALPEQIADPVAVFRSKTSGGMIVLTDMKDVNGELVIAAVHIGKRSGRRTVNDIASVHGRPDADFMRWLSDGSLLYLNEKKNPASPMGLSLQLLRRNPSWRGNTTIVGPDDVVKFHESDQSFHKSTLPALLVFFKKGHSS